MSCKDCNIDPATTHGFKLSNERTSKKTGYLLWGLCDSLRLINEMGLFIYLHSHVTVREALSSICCRSKILILKRGLAGSLEQD